MLVSFLATSDGALLSEDRGTQNCEWLGLCDVTELSLRAARDPGRSLSGPMLLPRGSWTLNSHVPTPLHWGEQSMQPGTQEGSLSIESSGTWGEKIREERGHWAGAPVASQTLTLTV